MRHAAVDGQGAQTPLLQKPPQQPKLAPVVWLHATGAPVAVPSAVQHSLVTVPSVGGKQLGASALGLGPHTSVRPGHAAPSSRQLYCVAHRY